MTTPISGKNGKVEAGGSAISEILRWEFTPTCNNPSWASSSTAGFKDRLAGVKDGSGTFDAKLDTDSEIYDSIVEGDEVELKLYLNATLYFTVPAIIDSIRYSADVNDGEVIEYTASFSTRGEWTKPA